MSFDRSARTQERQRRAWQTLALGGGITFDQDNGTVGVALGAGLELDGTDQIQADLDASSLQFSGSDIQVIAGEGIKLDSGVALDIDGLTAQAAPGFDDSMAIYDDGAAAHRKVLLEELAELLIPPGVVTAYGAAAAPSGWLLCDGSAVSRTTFARLFAAIGTTFGVGDGSTTFNVPDLRQRFPLGVAASGTGSTLGGTGGTIDHDHAVSGGQTGSPNFAECLPVNESFGGLDEVWECFNELGVNLPRSVVSDENPPFLAMQFIIKT